MGTGGENTTKTEQVRNMFDNIAHRYDFLNHFLSLGIDKLWRKKLVRLLSTHKPGKILDVASGTADLAIAAATATEAEITGVDISEKMLEKGRQKVLSLGLQTRIELTLADSLSLPFQNNSFDAVMVAFGVRNFEDLGKGLSEFNRVLKPGTRAYILEFSTPGNFPVKQLYMFYFKKVLPALGRWISKDKGAYTYLPESVEAFPSGETFLAIMTECGFKELNEIRLTFGIASIYVGKK